MADLLYHSFVFAALFSYGIYHLVSSTRSFFSPTVSGSADYTAKPYYPFLLKSNLNHFLRHLPLYIAFFSLLFSIAHHAFLFSSSLQTAASLLLFLFIAVLLLIPLYMPNGLIFLLAAVGFALLASVSSAYQHSDLQFKCDSVSSVVSAASAVFSLALAVCPRLFLAEFGLAASVSLQGLWSLQTLLSLYVERFVPEGCHRLLEVRDGSVRCELEDSRSRAAGLLDLAFVLHTVFVCVVCVGIYAVVSCGSGGGFPRRYNGGSYEALPTSLTGGGNDLDHIQMKAMTKHSTQA